MTAPGPSGVIVIDKPEGTTSHGVVGQVRRAMGTRKVGHAGTLDPMATGVLVVGVGRATRLLGHLALHDKDYTATVRLGASTVTDDREGDVVSVADPRRLAEVTDSDIRAGVLALTGEIDQVPTAVSAIKVDGRRAHELVRAGQDVDLAPRRVTVERFDLRAIRREAAWIDLDVDVTCSTGTYVRALARDLGLRLAVGGHLTRLRRTRVGAWSLSSAVSVEALVSAAEPAALLTDLGACAAASFSTAVVADDVVTWIANGRPLAHVLPGEVLEPTAVLDAAGGLVALVGPSDRGTAYLAVFTS